LTQQTKPIIGIVMQSYFVELEVIEGRKLVWDTKECEVKKRKKFFF
jgi:hypothetical protein